MESSPAHKVSWNAVGAGRMRALASQLGAGLGLIILVIALSLVSPNFSSANNFSNILSQASYVGIIAAAQTLVILTGGIDLCVGSVMALSGVLAAGFMTGFGSGPNVGAPAAMLIGIAAGAGVGICNGGLVAYAKMPPFIVTLASMLIARGLATVYTGGQTIYGLPDQWGWLAGNLRTFGGFNFPVAAIFMLATFLILAVVAAKTQFGRRVYAVGGNEEATRLSGVQVKWVKLAVYTISGLLAGVSGVLMIFRLGSGLHNTADMYELDAIAACVIGGASLNGGVGTVSGSLIGVLIMGCVRSGLVLLNVSPYWQRVVIGSIILIAVGIDMLRKRASERP